MRMYEVTVSGYVRHNDVLYVPGDVISGVTEDEVQRLERIGVLISKVRMARDKRLKMVAGDGEAT